MPEASASGVSTAVSPEAMASPGIPRSVSSCASRSFARPKNRQRAPSRAGARDAPARCVQAGMTPALTSVSAISSLFLPRNIFAISSRISTRRSSSNLASMSGEMGVGSSSVHRRHRVLGFARTACQGLERGAHDHLPQLLRRQKLVGGHVLVARLIHPCESRHQWFFSRRRERGFAQELPTLHPASKGGTRHAFAADEA